jgi:hypothetical protein
MTPMCMSQKCQWSSFSCHRRCQWHRCAYHSCVNDTAVQPTLLNIFANNPKHFFMRKSNTAAHGTAVSLTLLWHAQRSLANEWNLVPAILHPQFLCLLCHTFLTQDFLGVRQIRDGWFRPAKHYTNGCSRHTILWYSPFNSFECQSIWEGVGRDWPIRSLACHLRYVPSKSHFTHGILGLKWSLQIAQLHDFYGAA